MDRDSSRYKCAGNHDSRVFLSTKKKLHCYFYKAKDPSCKKIHKMMKMVENNNDDDDFSINNYSTCNSDNKVEIKKEDEINKASSIFVNNDKLKK